LTDYRYTPHAIAAVLAYTAAHGTPSGSAYLDREDEADATEAYISGLDPVPYSSPEWGPDGLDIEAGCNPIPDPLPDLRDPHEWA
jgi:hypothetical protein